MPVTAKCENCQAKFRGPDEKAGKRSKCPKCGEVMTFSPATSRSASIASTKSDNGSDEAQGERTPTLSRTVLVAVGIGAALAVVFLVGGVVRVFLDNWLAAPLPQANQVAANEPPVKPEPALVRKKEEVPPKEPRKEEPRVEPKAPNQPDANPGEQPKKLPPQVEQPEKPREDALVEESLVAAVPGATVSVKSAKLRTVPNYAVEFILNRPKYINRISTDTWLVVELEAVPTKSKLPAPVQKYVAPTLQDEKDNRFLEWATSLGTVIISPDDTVAKNSQRYYAVFSKEQLGKGKTLILRWSACPVGLDDAIQFKIDQQKIIR